MKLPPALWLLVLLHLARSEDQPDSAEDITVRKAAPTFYLGSRGTLLAFGFERSTM